MNEIKIMGEWDGQPIWREKTSGELLAEELEKEEKEESDNKLLSKFY